MRTLLLYTIVWTCTGLIFEEDLGVLTPQDPNVTVGSNLTVSCKLNLTHPKLVGAEGNRLNARNIYFMLSHKYVDSSFVRISENLAQADLSYPNISSDANNKHIKCYVDTGSEDADDHIFVDSQHLIVGYRPRNITLLDVTVHNWKKLTFNWTKEENKVYRTGVYSWWKLKNDTAFTSCVNYTEGRGASIELCEVDLSEVIAKAHAAGEDVTLELKVTASNLVGKAETRSVVTVSQIVKPSPVNSLTLSPDSSTEIQLVWLHPKSETYPLQYEVTYIDEWDQQSKVVYSSEPSLTLRNLERFTNYTVKVRCRSLAGGYWSDYVTGTAKTLPSVPAATPGVVHGSFHAYQINDTSRNVTVYWQSINPRYLQGPLEGYVVRVPKEYLGRRRIENVFVLGDQNHVTLQGLDLDKSYVIWVEAKTTVGLNESSEPHIISVPPQINVNNLKTKFPIIVAQNETVIHVRWDRTEDPPQRATLFWCENYARDNLCKSELQWKYIDSNTVSEIVGLAKGYTAYQYGIAFDTESGSSGIQWILCIHNVNNYAGHPTIDIKERGISSITLSLREPDCYRDPGVVDKYRLTWCLQDDASSYDSNCPVSSQHKTISFTKADNVVIDHLIPATRYRIEATTITETLKTRSNDPANQFATTQQELGGLSKGVLAVIIIVIVILFMGVIFAMFAFRGWICKFLHNKIGRPDLSTIEEDGYTKLQRSPVGKNNGVAPPSQQPEYAEPESVPLFPVTTPVEDRVAPSGKSSESEESDFPTSGVGFSLSDSGETSYPHDHMFHKQKRVKGPPTIYVKDNSYNKNPVFYPHTETNNLDLSGLITNATPAKVEPPPSRLVTDSAVLNKQVQPQNRYEVRSKKASPPKDRRIQPKRPKPTQFTNPLLDAKKPDVDHKVPYGRGDSTDSSASSSSSGCRYAPARLGVDTVKEDTSSDEATGLSSGDFSPMILQGPFNVDSPLASVAGTTPSSGSSDRLAAAPPSGGSHSSAGRDQNPTVNTENRSNDHRQQLENNGDTSSKANKLDERSNENSDDGLEWDDSEDEDDDFYTKQKTKEIPQGEFCESEDDESEEDSVTDTISNVD